MTLTARIGRAHSYRARSTSTTGHQGLLPLRFFEFNSSLCYHPAHGRFYHGEARSGSRCLPSIFPCSP